MLKYKWPIHRFTSDILNAQFIPNKIVDKLNPNTNDSTDNKVKKYMKNLRLKMTLLKIKILNIKMFNVIFN